MDSKSVHCVFFLKRACKKGDDCPFLHDQSLFSRVQTARSQEKSKVPCIFYQKGKCFKGEDCPFSHEQAAGISDPAHPSSRSAAASTVGQASTNPFGVAASYQAPSFGGGFGSSSIGTGHSPFGSVGGNFGKASGRPTQPSYL